MRARRKEAGISLIEVLATLVVLSMVVIIVFSITSSATKKNNEQISTSNQIQNAAYVLKVITKDLRKVGDVVVNGNQSILGGTITYELIDGKLYREGTVIGQKIEQFKLHEIMKTDTNTGSLVSTGEAIIEFKMDGEQYKTVITLRKGDF